MKFTAMPIDKFTQAYAPLSEGEAFFTIKSCVEKETDNGKRYLDINYEIIDCKGVKGRLWNKLFFTDESMWRVYQWCLSIGREKWYKEQEIITQSAEGKTGNCMLKIKKGSNGYSDKLDIKDFTVTNMAQDSDSDEFNDDVQF